MGRLKKSGASTVLNASAIWAQKNQRFVAFDLAASAQS
jgi:hypothetical protein